MNYGPSTYQSNLHFLSDLENGIDSCKDLINNTKYVRATKCPHLLLKIQSIDTWSLLDTGSQATAVSDLYYEKLRKHINVRELPVTNVRVSTAIGKKNSTVKRQILLEFKIDDYVAKHIFLVIPYLSCDIVLGNDWNWTYGVIINHIEGVISIKNKLVSKESMMFESTLSERIVISQEDNITHIFLTKF